MDKRGSCVAQLTDLSKTFNCIVHDFVFAKLEGNEFTYEALKAMHGYLRQKTHN